MGVRRRLIGAAGREQVLFDVEDQKVVGTLGPPEAFPNPAGDIALSPDGKWFVNGHSERGKNYYTILRRAGRRVGADGRDLSRRVHRRRTAHRPVAELEPHQ